MFVSTPLLFSCHSFAHGSGQRFTGQCLLAPWISLRVAGASWCSLFSVPPWGPPYQFLTHTPCFSVFFPLRLHSLSPVISCYALNGLPLTREKLIVLVGLGPQFLSLTNSPVHSGPHQLFQRWVEELMWSSLLLILSSQSLSRRDQKPGNKRFGNSLKNFIHKAGYFWCPLWMY